MRVGRLILGRRSGLFNPLVPALLESQATPDTLLNSLFEISKAQAPSIFSIKTTLRRK